jgi:CBS domain-containing protein
MLVKDVMTISPMCCKPSDTLDRVAKLMLEHDCGFIPVCKATKLVGVITDRDITCRAVAAGEIPIVVPVSEVMTKPVYTVRQDQDVQAAIELMEAKQIRRLPVLDDEDNVVGIIAPSDLAPIFASTNVADFLLAVSYWTRRTVVSAAAVDIRGSDMDLS